MEREATVSRKTRETEIRVELRLDGTGEAEVRTGMPFFDHLLEAFARHGFFDLRARADGDIEVDQHHTVEDVGICLGQAITQAVGDKAGIERYGHAYVPMDEALARAAVDLSGRAYLVLEAAFNDEQVGELPVALVREFFYAVADQGRMNLHLDLIRAQNDHHGVEALFKAFARALDAASRKSDRVQGIPSTKGAL